MNAHQIITGALNDGENVYSIGSVEGITFTACAVGSDVVILGPDFNRVQVVPECSHNQQLVSSVSCCQDTGKIAVTYGNVVRILEATNIHVIDKPTGSSAACQYNWVETHCFTVKGTVTTVLWNMEGMRMLFVIGNEMMLYQHRSVSCTSRAGSSAPVMFCIAEEEVQETHSWDVVWNIDLSEHPKYIKYSPDGTYLAVAGEFERFVKIFYQSSEETPDSNILDFSFVSLNHPAPVRGFEWRRTGRYMPRKCIQAALISWCADNTSRIWKETPPPELSIIDLSGDGGEPGWDKTRPKRIFGKHIRVKKTKNRIITKLKTMLKPDNEAGLGLRAQIGKSPSFNDLQSHNMCHTNVEFHLAGTVNAETDVLLVPSLEGNVQKPLCVHWLNNKELVFSVGAEKLLAEAVLMESDSQGTSCGTSPERDEKFEVNGHAERLVGDINDGTSSENPSSKDILDVKLEILLRQWSKTNDILFTFHPIDGSLLTWTVEWMDDLHRQPVISYSSRFPGALPTSDAGSIQSTLNTFNPHEPLYIDVLRRDLDSKEAENAQQRLSESSVANTIHVLTSHDNGTLNLWHMAVDENSFFSQILNITHISRMCGHRFRIRQVIAHPVLPLLLTTSKFESKNDIEDPKLDYLSEVILWKISPVGPLCKTGGVKELARVGNSLREGFSILSWIPAILPSCTLGTVCNSPSSCFIANDGNCLVIYQAVIDARGLLAELSNADSSTFGGIIESETDEETASLTPSPRKTFAPSFLREFNVVSTQSTAKPGCVLEIGRIEDEMLRNIDISFLHVFQARLVISETSEETEEVVPMGSVIDRSKNAVFSDQYYIVMVQKDDDGENILMYSLTISSQEPQPIPTFDTEILPDEKDGLRPKSPLAVSMAKLKFEAELVCRQKFPLPSGTRIKQVSPAAGHLSSSSLYPACEAPYVLISSDEDDSVRFWRCERNKDSSSSNKYEWREWNMISDNRPSELGIEGSIYGVSAAHSGRLACAYDSESVSGDSNSVEIAVFECESSGGVEWLREDTLSIRNISTFCNKNFDLFHGIRPGSPRYERATSLSPRTDFGVITRLRSSFRGLSFALPNGPSEDLVRAMTLNARHEHEIPPISIQKMIRLDWVSTEDGSHMLTAGVGAKIYVYTQISQDLAQQNVALMKDSETTMRRPSLRKASSLLPNMHAHSRLTRWVCIRLLELDSTDGLPPIPTSLSWARDGLLIVGMQSEMRVYNQWNFEPHDLKNGLDMTRRATNPHIVSLPVSTSHSMLDQLHKKKEALATSRSRVILDLVTTMNKNHQIKEQESDAILHALSSEGLFEAARLSSPILPQYHPKQLIVLLNAGKTKRVKAILLHVLNALRQRQVTIRNPLSRAASIRRMSTVDMSEEIGAAKIGDVTRNMTFDEDSLDYDEIDEIAPLPLYALLAADNDTEDSGDKADGMISKAHSGYDSLFTEEAIDDAELDAALTDSDSSTPRSRHTSLSSDSSRIEHKIVSTQFTAKHNRVLTELLTHTHLPGLSSVDQMHLLAMADTLSHFSSNVIDKLTAANAAMQPVVQSVLGDSSASGYATAAAGVETLDECGLRYLMAMKQHEYLLVCLPLNQRVELKMKGLSSSHIIWAQHSETETELLNAVPGIQKANPTWDELRSLGIAWWLKNTSSLKICIEKLAKAAFQQNQDPMDASLFYLALRKKNVLTHLFKTSRNQMMSEFFQNDFNTDHWKKVAAKNAFVLMSKQRFQHAAAFFLLSGSLKDAMQTILTKCNDLQLALVVLRLYENDIDTQQAIMKEILCREVLGTTPDDFETNRGKTDEDVVLSRHASKDPFERSMAYWILKDYARAAHTLVEEAHGERNQNTSLSDIFNFYAYLRRHPLVVRQRLTDSGAQVGSTEKFLSVGKQLETVVTPAERRLYFRTAAEHMARGCPMLALDVLSRLPKRISLIRDFDEALRTLLGDEKKTNTSSNPPRQSFEVDWSAPTNVLKNDDLDLGWSDDEDEEKQEEKSKEPEIVAQENESSEKVAMPEAVDIIAQHMKFVASIRILTEELSTLASGFEVDGGQLRYQLFHWLEKEVDVLQNTCDYRFQFHSGCDLDEEETALSNSAEPSDVSLHEALKHDRAEMLSRLKYAARRRKWLTSNQKLLRSFTSFCALHSAQNHRLTSALMELLLLLLEVQKDTGVQHLNEPVPDMNSFPLLEASVSSAKMFVSSPLSFIENQCYDLLAAISQMHTAPSMDRNLQTCYMLYNLSQGLSSCLYQSLCDVEQIFSSSRLLYNDGKSGALTKRTRMTSSSEDLRVSTAPVKWPGVQSLIALLNREKDDEVPHLRLLLIESFVAITMSLFCFALAAYDARWLYRLSIHDIDPGKFGLIFGGGGEKRLKTAPPVRPPRPSAPRSKNVSEGSNASGENTNDANVSRSRLNLRVIGTESVQQQSTPNPAPAEQVITKWVPPHKNIVQLFAEKPSLDADEALGVSYDSDEESDDYDVDDDENERCENAVPTSFAWQLMRLALIEQYLHRIRQFLMLAGYDPHDIPGLAPRIEVILRLLTSWSNQQHHLLKNFPGGMPQDLLPNMDVDLTDAHLGATIKKYAVVVQRNNTPFESEDRKVQPMQRLWAYLVREDHLQPIFIRYIFAAKSQMENPHSDRGDLLTGIENQALPEAYKIIQKDHEPIVAFSCNQEKPGLVVVSNGRELQEMDISDIFNDAPDYTSWVWNRAELDMNTLMARKDPLRDNDDYQLFTENSSTTAPSTRTATLLTPWIVDRSRRGLQKLLKRNVAGVRRIDSHPSAPYYVTGSSDGSIKVWRWGGKDVVYTARVAGQHAKVSKISFSCNGNKFAAVDGDGMLCLWQACQSTEQRKPFFSQRCHNKSASDVRFLGHSSSVLITAGASSLDYNLGLWDTLLPQNRALVHTWVAHTEGATCAMYLPNQQTIVSGGRHGDICFWDIRQRQLRHTIKAFDATQIVKSLVTDVSQDLIVAGSSDGDVKVWSADANPQLMYVLPGEHATKGGFSFRQVGQQAVQGVQQMFIDHSMRLFSCGADASLKFRTLPSVYNMTNLV
ncbi:unnamed protein product [Caenorhabditis auriculariae]|uniref:RAVE complex protein Rav1 C-terminal domain-containing protein n=1 Tax=Caenorhabditis auriculariae TaxID=2777116 RepID=A0A8S1GV87_9PELO|nr:unnamed protein product [Caenorhabditis auriculariae]